MILVKLIASVAAIAAISFFLILLSTLYGVVAGWIVGLFFEQTIRDVFKALGADMSGIEIWQIGAAFGFVGSFFKTTVTKKKD